MIKTETLTINNTQYVKTYSDSGFYIHGGQPESDYSEAIDPAEFNRQYTETNIPIDTDESEAEEIVNILTGETP